MSPRLLFFVASHFALPQKEGGPVPFPRKDARPPGRRLAAGVLSPGRLSFPATPRALFAGGPAAKKGRGGTAL